MFKQLFNITCLKRFPSSFSNNSVKRCISGYDQSDSIFALSTAPGKAGVAIIRVSGNKSLETHHKLTKGKRSPIPRQAHLCTLYESDNKKEPIDRALTLYFPEPNSFTGEDVIEYHVHGGRGVIDGVLKALNNCDGMRSAEPGEFTKRAFMNNKLDLTEVEGLHDLINSETEAQRKQAYRQMSGELKDLYNDWRKKMIHTLANIEAIIDFGESEDDVSDSMSVALALTQELKNSIELHLDDDRRGERLRDGVHVAIVGPPNSGKSSMINFLSRRSTAIVSHIAGTTRDVVESCIDIGGYPVVIADTAGIRESKDIIEQEGVRRTFERINSSDAKIVMFDVEQLMKSLNNLTTEGKVPFLEQLLSPSTMSEKAESTEHLDQDLQNVSIGEHDMLVLNKSDLVIEEFQLEKVIRFLNISYPTTALVTVSCSTGKNMDEFTRKLTTIIKERCDHSSPAPTQERHRRHLEKCQKSLSRAFFYEDDPVLFCEELRYACHHLGYITGKVSLEDVLNELFSGFCIGK